MKRILFLLLLISSITNAQTYNMPYDSIKVGKDTGTPKVALYGKVFFKGISGTGFMYRAASGDWMQLKGLSISDIATLQTLLDGKAATSDLANYVPITRTINGHALSSNVTVSKSDIGLGSADNTSDANKPVSTATQTALNLKVDKTTTINAQPLSSNITLTQDNIGDGTTYRQYSATDKAQLASNTSNIASNTTAIAGKQATLVSGTNIKTINGTSVLGSGDIVVGGSVDSTQFRTVANSLSLAQAQTKLNTRISTTGQPKAVQYFNNSGTATQDSTKLKFNESTGTLYVGVNPAPTLSSTSMVFVGTSITTGIGATTTAQRYSTLTASYLGLTEVNVGRSGTMLGNPAVSSTSLINNLSVIPTKTAAHRYLLFEYGANDVSNGVTYTSSQFETDYHTVIDYALAHGWSASDIVLTTIVFINSDSPTGGQTSTQFKVRQAAFNTAIKNVGTSYGILVVDINDMMLKSGQDYLSADGIHPNDRGHYLMSRTIVKPLKGVVYQNSAKGLQVNDTTRVQALKMVNLNLKADSTTNGTLLMRDSNGDIGSVASLPPDTRVAGNFYSNGQYRQVGAKLPPSMTLNSNDFLLKYNSRIIGTYTPDNQYVNMIEIGDGSMAMNFSTGNTGNINFLVNRTTGGSADNVLTVNRADKSVYVPNGDLKITTLGKQVYSQSSSYRGGFIPMSAAGNTEFFNKIATGRVTFSMSNGTNIAEPGTGTQMFEMGATGKVTLQTGGTYTAETRSRMTINSTTEGILIPRMTTTQRDAMGTLKTVGTTVAGTGYTTATVSFTGGGGTGAAATANIVGGAITSYTITNAGTGYVTAPTIGITGDGTGATATATIDLTDGIQIYNTTTHRINFYTGSNWGEIPPIVGVPATATSTGVAGAIAYDSSYLYICTAANTWVRTPLSTW